jgi:hypothetical protein
MPQQDMYLVYGKKVKFAPSILLKYVPKYAPISIDFNANFIFIDRLWLGVSYRLSDSYGFMAAVNITRQFRVGYAYDLTVSPISHSPQGLMGNWQAMILISVIRSWSILDMSATSNTPNKPNN